MGGWVGKVLATVVAGVLVFYLTGGLDRLLTWINPDGHTPQPAQSGAQQGGQSAGPVPPVGYVVVVEAGPVRALGDLGSGARLCATRTTLERLRAEPALARFQTRVLPAPELYPAIQTGVCEAVLVERLDAVNSLFPVGLSGFRAVAVR